MEQLYNDLSRARNEERPTSRYLHSVFGGGLESHAFSRCAGHNLLQKLVSTVQGNTEKHGQPLAGAANPDKLVLRQRADLQRH